jgi:hypothetical protein
VHYSAQIEEIAVIDPAAGTLAAAKQANAGAARPRYVVDSWFRDNGQPAVVIGLQSWFDGQDDQDDEGDRAQLTTVLNSRGEGPNIER